MKSLLEDSVKLSYPGMRLQESSLTIRKRTTARVSAAFKGGGQIYAHLGALIDSPMEIFFVGWIGGIYGSFRAGFI